MAQEHSQALRATRVMARVGLARALAMRVGRGRAAVVLQVKRESRIPAAPGAALAAAPAMELRAMELQAATTRAAVRAAADMQELAVADAPATVLVATLPAGAAAPQECKARQATAVRPEWPVPEARATRRSCPTSRRALTGGCPGSLIIRKVRKRFTISSPNKAHFRTSLVQVAA